MIVLIADGIIIVIMIMIGKMTEAIAEKANKEMTTIPKIKEGKTGTVEIKEGVIAAGRHIHMNTVDAEKFGVKDKDIVKVRCDGERGLVFENVLIRVHESFCLEMHIDTDEANAAMCKNGGTVEIIK